MVFVKFAHEHCCVDSRLCSADGSDFNLTHIELQVMSDLSTLKIYFTVFGRGLSKYVHILMAMLGTTAMLR